MLRDLSFKDFKKQNGHHYIEKAKVTGGLLLVKADWCGHCKRVKPILEEVSKKLGKAYPIYKLDADSESEVVSSLGVEGFPTIFYIDRDGKVSGKYEGDRSVPSFLDGICKVSLVCKK